MQPKWIAVTACALGIVTSAAIVARTTRLRSRQIVVAPLADPPVDRALVAARLAEVLKRPTVSMTPQVLAPAAELAALRADLEHGFPLVHAKLTRELIADHSLLYTWKGESDLPGLLLCAHQDVVPVEPGTEGKWHAPPFGGRIDDQFVWGRGAIDDKGSLVAILQAVELLAQEGFRPKRTVYLAFGHDEEVLGLSGAAQIAAQLAARGVRLEAVIDEGMPMLDGVVAGVPGRVAPIGIVEKGYLTLKLSVDAGGGHSAAPARDSAIDLLNGALARLREHPMPARFEGATAEFYDWLAPEMPLGQRLLLSNTWLTWPLVSRALSKSPASNASIRTTTAITVLRAGVKDNVVPRNAEAEVNFRILPGDTTDGVIAHVRNAIDDPRVTVAPVGDLRIEPSRVSRTDSRAFATIAATVREVFPGAVVAPGIVLGTTDSRKYEPVADDVYRIVPIPLAREDIGRFHGTDERISIDALANAVRFYRRVVRELSGS